MWDLLFKYLGKVNIDILRTLIDNQINLTDYEPTAKWINENIGYMKKIYFFLPKKFDFDKVLLDGRKYNEEVYRVVSTPLGRKWLAIQMWLIKQKLEK